MGEVGVNSLQTVFSETGRASACEPAGIIGNWVFIRSTIFLLAKNSVDPGNAELALLRLNDNVVALLEAIEVILIHGDMFKAAAHIARK